MDMPLKPNVLEDIGRDVSKNRLRRRLLLSNSYEALPPSPSAARENTLAGRSGYAGR